MHSVTFNDIRIFNATQFKESVSEPTPNTKIFLTIGKVDGWANDADPEQANTCQQTKFTVWDNMIGGKRLVSSDMEHVIPRINWTANTVYTAYDHMNSEMINGNTQFYVVTDAYNVYKCISNNYSGMSTAKPTATNPSTMTETSDGYIWKYMYTISNSDRLKFTNNDYIPVKTLESDTGSLQWTVQDEAIDGGIHNIIVTDGGSNYSNANSITVTISGDGSDATATASVNTISNTISAISITNPGDGYTFATVSITGGGGSGAVARAVMSPPKGHGSNPLYELGGKNLMINARLNFSEEGKLPVTNEYRQVALILNPTLRGTNNVSSNSAFNQSYLIATIGIGSYDEDEWVYQGGSLAGATYKGRVVSWDAANGIVQTINNVGVPSSDALIGANTTTSRFVSSTTLNEFAKNSGQILYLNNIEPITRASDQQEMFQILLKF